MRPHARLSDDGAPLHRRTSGEDDLADWLKKELMTHEIFRKFRFNSSGMLGINNNSNPIESHHRFLTTPTGPLRARASREFLFYSGYRKLTGEDATKASKLLRDDAEKAGNHVTGEWPARDRLGFIVVPEQYVAKAASFMNADICWSDTSQAFYFNSTRNMGKVTINEELVAEYDRCLAGSPATSLAQHDGTLNSVLGAIANVTRIAHNIHKVWWSEPNGRFECDCEGYWTWRLCAHVLAVQHIHWAVLGSFLPGADPLRRIRPLVVILGVLCSKTSRQQDGRLRLLHCRAKDAVGRRSAGCRSNRSRQRSQGMAAEQPRCA